MQGLFSLLLFAAFFYLMMRFGCGAHMVHGNQGHGGNPVAGSSDTPASDPVCGMSVSAEQGYSEVYGREKYRFCSRECLDKFDADRNRYVPRRGALQ